MFPLVLTVLGNLVHPTIIPIKDCSYKGDHPNLTAFRKAVRGWLWDGVGWGGNPQRGHHLMNLPCLWTAARSSLSAFVGSAPDPKHPKRETQRSGEKNEVLVKATVTA